MEIEWRKWLRSSWNGIFVLQSGIISSAVVLGCLWCLAHYRIVNNVLGWYLLHIIPVGSLVAGVCAALGYAIAAKYTGFRVTKWFCALVIVVQVGVYLSAEYVEYQQLDLTFEDGQKLGFWPYFDAVSRSYAMQTSKYGEGNLYPSGYFVRALEMLGFAAGGLLAPMTMVGMTRCRKCDVYENHRAIRQWWFTPTVAYEQWRESRQNVQSDLDDSDEAYHVAQSEEFIRPLRDAIAQTNDVAAGEAIADIYARTNAEDAPLCLIYGWLDYCPQCETGVLKLKVTWKANEWMKVELLDDMQVPPSVVKVLRAQPAAVKV